MLPNPRTALLSAALAALLVGAASAASILPRGPEGTAAPAGPLRDAMALVARGDLALAEERFTTLRDANGRLVAPWLGLAEVAARRNDPEEAGRRLREGLGATGGAPELHRALGRLAAQLGDGDGMVAAFTAAQRARPGDAVSYLELAELLQERFGETERSLVLYEAALARDSGNGRAAYGRGLALARLGQPDRAIPALSEAARLNAASALPDFARAQVLARSNRPAEALAAYDAAILRDPDMAEARRAKGALLVGLRRPREAVPEFERVLAREPGEVNALLGVAMAREALGEGRAAAEGYRAVLARFPDNPIALNNLAWLLAGERGELDEALRRAEGAVAALPEDASALTTLGWVRRQRGELAEAEAVLTRAVALQPNGDRLMRLGMVRAGLGRRAEAVADLRRAVRADPDSAAARRELRRLEGGR